MPVVVRAATAADAEGISRVHIGAWLAAYRGLVTDDFLDSLNDRVAGRIAWWHQLGESNARARRFYERGGWAADGATKTEHIGGAPMQEVRYRRAIGG